jgi:hypothetical protein
MSCSSLERFSAFTEEEKFDEELKRPPRMYEKRLHPYEVAAVSSLLSAGSNREEACELSAYATRVGGPSAGDISSSGEAV